jgi:hypothetical protein
MEQQKELSITFPLDPGCSNCYDVPEKTASQTYSMPGKAFLVLLRCSKGEFILIMTYHFYLWTNIRILMYSLACHKTLK